MSAKEIRKKIGKTGLSAKGFKGNAGAKKIVSKGRKVGAKTKAKAKKMGF